MGHTPGPWVVREPDADERLADIAEGRSPEDMELTEVYADDGGQQVCYVMNDTPDEAANARLIAAAPEMLAALRRMREVFEQLADGDWRHHDATYVDQLIESDGLHGCDQVIAKAEGRSDVKD
jgi:hypothetical protein